LVTADLTDRSLSIKGAYSDGPDTRMATAFVRRLGHSGYTAFELQIASDGEIDERLLDENLFGWPGEIELVLSFLGPQGWLSFPDSVPGRPTDFGYRGDGVFNVDVTSLSQDLTVFDMARDHAAMIYPHTWGYGKYEIDNTRIANLDSLGLRIRYKHFPTTGSLVAIRSQLDRNLTESRIRLKMSDVLVIESAAKCDADITFEIALTSDTGRALGTKIAASGLWTREEIPVAELHQVRFAILPRAYPIFQPEFLEPAGSVGPEQLINSFGHINGAQVMARNEAEGPVETSECELSLGKVVLRK
jgi:hypothetical protein